MSASDSQPQLCDGRHVFYFDHSVLGRGQGTVVLGRIEAGATVRFSDLVCTRHSIGVVIEIEPPPKFMIEIGSADE